MNVTEAVATRRSVRAFTDQPVDQAVLQRVLTTAQRFHQLVPTNLVEWVDDAPIDCSNPVALTLKPFEIQTFKLKA